MAARPADTLSFGYKLKIRPISRSANGKRTAKNNVKERNLKSRKFERPFVIIIKVNKITGVENNFVEI